MGVGAHMRVGWVGWGCSFDQLTAVGNHMQGLTRKLVSAAAIKHSPIKQVMRLLYLGVQRASCPSLQPPPHSHRSRPLDGSACFNASFKRP